MPSVHSFGPYNFHQEHNKFRALLNGIHSRCKQCKSWSNSKHAVKAFVVSKLIKLIVQIGRHIYSTETSCAHSSVIVVRGNTLFSHNKP